MTKDLYVENDAGPIQEIVQQFVINVLPTGLREEMLEDRPHLVANASMMAEGVWNGSKGPVFYPADEFKKTAHSWNNKPAVVYHPQGGKGSAADPNVLSSSRAGILLNTRWESEKLKTEVWLDVERTNRIDDRIITNLKAGKPIEVSTGLIVDGQMLENEAEHGGKKYKLVAKNFRPDHLAILPDKVGAYSIKDGGGLLANHRVDPVSNEDSLSEKMDKVRRAIYDRFANAQPGYYWDGYVCEVYEDYVVYRAGNQMYSIDYKIEDGNVTLTGDPVPVERVVEYRKTTGEYVGNAAGHFVPNLEAVYMDKKAQVDWLIANGGYPEADRSELMATPDKVLKKMVDDGKKTKETTVNNAVQTPTPPPAGPQTTPTTVGSHPVQVTPPSAQPTPTQNGPTVITLNDLKTKGDDATKAMVAAFEQNYNAEVEQHVQNVMKATKNPYTEADLRGMPLDQLRKVSVLAGDSQQYSLQVPGGMNGMVANYQGNGMFLNQRPAPITETPIEDLD